MEEIKAAFLGRLNFGSTKSFKNAISMFSQRADFHYRAQILIDETCFSENELALIIPKKISPTNDKIAQNTIAILEYIVQFSVSGYVSYWLLSRPDDDISGTIEPPATKSICRSFIKGRKLFSEGDLIRSLEVLSKVIEKDDRHALAYHLRGLIHEKQDNLQDALCDFTRSLQLDPHFSKGYFGRGRINMKLKQFEAALKDMSNCVRLSFAKEDHHWIARKYRAECLFHLERLEESHKELRLFLGRNFQPEQPPFQHLHSGCLLMGEILTLLEDQTSAIEYFVKAQEIELASSLEKRQNLESVKD